MDERRFIPQDQPPKIESLDKARRDSWHAQELSRMFREFVTEIKNAASMLNIYMPALERHATDLKKDLETQQLEGRPNPWVSFHAQRCLEEKRDIENQLQRFETVLKELELFVNHLPEIWPNDLGEMKAELDRGIAEARQVQNSNASKFGEILPDNLESYIEPGQKEMRQSSSKSTPTVLQRNLASLREDMNEYLKQKAVIEQQGPAGRLAKAWVDRMSGDNESLLTFLEQLESKA